MHRLPLRTAVLAGLALAGAVGAPAASAGSLHAAFASVDGHTPIGAFTTLTASQAFNLDVTAAADPSAVVFHARTGRYEVRFPGNAVLNQAFVGGGIQVQAVDPAAGVCQPAGKPSGIIGNQLAQQVSCTDRFGIVRDLSFSIAYGQGRADGGSLVLARTETVLGATLAPLPAQETTLDGVIAPGAQVFGVRTGVGAYTLEVPVLPGVGPTVTNISPVNNDAAGQGGVTCGILSARKATSARAGHPTVRQIKVRCRGPLSAGPRDVALDLAHARDANVHGLQLALNRVLVNAPRTTKPQTTLSAGQARSVAGVLSGLAVTLQRTDAGQYHLLLAGQGASLTSVQVTAVGSTASCAVTRQGFAGGVEDLQLACVDSANQPVDTAFQLLYDDAQKRAL